MTLEQFKKILDANGLPGLPPTEGTLYTRFFVELSGFDHDWTICADVYDLNSFLCDLESTFDLEDSMHEAKIRSVGLDSNQLEWIQKQIEHG